MSSSSQTTAEVRPFPNAKAPVPSQDPAVEAPSVPAEAPASSQEPAAPKKKRDVFLFVISGAKKKNPAAAQGIIAALG